MEKIILIEPGEFTKEMIEKLETKGVTVIECKNPDKVKILQDNSFAFMAADDLFMSALEGANWGDSSRNSFARELIKRAKATELKKQT